MLDMFSLVYFVWVLSAILLITGVYFAMRNKSATVRYWFLFGLTVFAWVIHFARYWLDPDLLMHNMFFVDLCGFSTLVYPFFFLSKNPLYKDYMYFVGGLFAAHSLFYPNDIEGDPILYYNTIRFFFAHSILVGVPVLLVLWKMHVPNWRNIPKMVIFVLVGALYSFSISSFFYEVGLTTRHMNYMGLWGNTDSVYRLFERVAPFMRYTVVEYGVEVSKPIPYFYMIPGLLLFYTPVWILMSMPFWERWRKGGSQS